MRRDWLTRDRHDVWENAAGRIRGRQREVYSPRGKRWASSSTFRSR